MWPSLRYHVEHLMLLSILLFLSLLLLQGVVVLSPVGVIGARGGRLLILFAEVGSLTLFVGCLLHLRILKRALDILQQLLVNMSRTLRRKLFCPRVTQVRYQLSLVSAGRRSAALMRFLDGYRSPLRP